MTRKRATLLAGLLALGGRAFALPEGGQVQAGSVQTNTAGSTMTIQQMSDRAIINWNGFSIGANELVNVLQPNQAAILLNRVVGQDPSQILGQLNANGNIWLLNPNGILFGAGAQINVGGLLASTLNLSDRDFLAGKYNFTQSPDKPLASVVNQGELHISPNGYLILAAPLVSNEGLIVANLGKVAMLAGDQMSISLDSQGLINYRLAQAGASAGPVLLSPDMVSDVLKSVVQRGEIAEANIITQSDGKVWLGNGAGTVIQAGTIQAPNLVIDSQKETLLRTDSLISLGTGGEAKILSQGTTWAQRGSNIDAPNGNLEISGHRLAAAGTVNLGPTGSLLLDPDFLTIVQGTGDLDQNPIGPGDNPGGSSTIGTDFLAAINGGTITLQAENTLTVAALAGPLVLSPNISISLTAVTGDVIFTDVNTAIVANGTANIDITAGRDIVLGQLQTDLGSRVTLTAGRDILSAGTLALGEANVRSSRLDLSAPGNVGLSTASASPGAPFDLNSANVGNLTLVQDGRLDVGAVTATENVNISTIANVSPKPDLAVHGVIQAGTSVTFNSAGDLRVDVDEFVTTITAPDVFLQSSGDVVAQIFGEPGTVADFVSSTNLAVVAGNQIRGAFFVSTSNIAMQAGNSIFAILDGGATVGNVLGVNGVNVTNPGGDIYLEADSGNLHINAPVTATFVDLEAFGGSITQGVSGIVQTDSLLIGSDVNADVTMSSLTVASPELDAFVLGNLNVTSNNSTTVFDLESSNGDVRLNVTGDIDLQATVFAPGLMSVNVTGNLNNNQGGEGFLAVGGQLALRVGSFSGDSLFTDVGVLAADVGGSLVLSQDGPLQVGSLDGLNGIHSNGDVQLTVGQLFQGPPISLDILAPISAQNVTLNTIDVDLNINSPGGPVTGATGVEINVSGGNLNLTGQAVASPLAVITVDGPVTGSGPGNLLVDNLTMSSLSSITASGGAFSTANQTVTLQANGDLNYTSGNSTFVSAANSTAGNINFQVAGDLHAATAIQGTDLIEVHSTGALSADTVFAQSPRLLLDLVDQTAQVRIQTGTLAATSLGNLNLVNAGSLIVGDINSTFGLNVGATLSLVTEGDLTLNSQVFGPGVSLGVGGQLTSNVIGPGVFAADLSLNVNSQAPGTLEVAASRLVTASNDSLDLTLNGPVVEMLGGTVTNNLRVANSSSIRVTGPVHAGNITLDSSAGDLILQTPAPDAALSADHNVSLNASSGRITMTDLGVAAENVSLVSSGNIIGTPILLPNVFADRLNINTTGGNTSLFVEGFTPPPPGVLLNSTLNVTSTGNVTLRSTASDLNVDQLVSGGDIRLTGPNDIAINGTLTSTGLISVNAGGNLTTNTSGVLFDADRLAVRAFGVVGGQLRTDANTLAGRFTSDVELVQNTALTIGTADGLSGLQSSANLLLTLGGDTQISQTVAAQNVTVNMGINDQLTVNAPIAGSTGVEINMAGGLLNLNGNAVATPVAVLSVNGTFGTGANNLLADSLTVTSSGAFTASGGAFSLPSQTVDIVSTGDVNYAAANTTVVSQLSSSAGNVNLSVNGDLSTFSPITAVDLVNVSVTGSPTAAGVFAQAPRFVLDAGDVSTQLLVETGLVAAHSNNNLNLAQNTGDLTVGNVVGFMDGISAVNDVTLAVSNNLQLDSPISGQNVDLLVSGNLVNTQSAPAVVSNSLDVVVGSQTGAPLTVDTRNLSLQSNANMTVDARGTVNVVGATIFNNLTLTGDGETTVTGQVLAGNVSLTKSSGNLTLSNPLVTAVQGANQVNVQLLNGNLTMTDRSIAAPNVNVQTSGDILGSGLAPNVAANSLTLVSSGGVVNATVGSYDLPIFGLFGSAAGNLSLTAVNDTNLNGASSATGDILVDVTGNLQLVAPITAPGVVNLTVSNNLNNALLGTAVTADRLALTVGDLTGLTLRTDVHTLTADSGGNLTIAQATPLTIGTPAGLGVHAVNNATLLLSGETTITQPVSAQNVSIQMSGANLTVNAPSPGINGTSTVGITTSGGNLTLIGNAVSTPSANLNLGGDLLGLNGQILADSLTIASTGTVTGHGGALSGPSQTVTLSSAGDLNYAADNSTIISAASSSAGNVNLSVTGDVNALAPISAADLVNVTVTGSPSASGVFASSPRLTLQVGDNTSPLTINTGLLAATSASNINLVQSAPLTVGTIGTIAGIQAGSALNLTTGDLRLDSPLTGAAVNLQVTGVLTSNQTIPSVTGGSLSVNLAQDTFNPITVDVRSLSGHSDGNLTVTSTGTLDLAALSVANNLTLTGDGDTRAVSPVTAGNISIDVGTAEFRAASRSGTALQATNTVDVRAGTVNLVGNSVAAPTVSLQAAGNITGSLASPQVLVDTLTANSSGGELAFSFAPFSLAQTTASLSAAGNISVGSGSLVLQSASTVTGDILLDVTGNLQLDGALQSPGVMSVNVTGVLTNNNAGPAAIGNQLALRIGDYAGAPLQTQVNTLAASTGGNLALSQATPLTIDTVDGLNGISAAGDVLLVLGGETTINQAVTGQNVTVQVTGANLTLNAAPGLTGTTGVEVDMLGGNLTLTGTGIAAPTVALSLSNDFSGATGGILADNLIVSSGGNFTGQGSTLTPLATQTVSLNSVGNLTYVSPGSLTVNSASSSGANVSLNVNGDLSVLSPITAADLVSVSVTGSPTASGLFASAPRLALQSGDISSPLSLNVGTLAASGSNNLNFFQASPLTVGTIGSLIGISANKDLTLTTGSDLQLDSPLTAQSVILNVGGQLNNTQSGPAVVANSLTLTEASQSANPLTLDVRNLTAHSDSSLNVAGTGTLNVQAANATNNVTLGGTSETTVSGPVQAVNISVAQSSGNVTLSGAAPVLQGSQTVDVALANGNLMMVGPSITAPTVTLAASGGIQSSGAAPQVRANNLTVGSSAGGVAVGFDPLSLPQTTVTASAFGNLALNSASNTFLEQATSTSGNVDVDVTGNLRLDGPVQSPGVMSVNVTGTLTNNNFGPAAIGNQLALRVGDLNGQPLATQVNVVAASTQGNLTLSQSTPLTVGSVDGLNGISAVGNVSLLLGGETQINAPVTGQNVSVGINGANLTINAPGLSGSTGVEVTTAGGNMTLNGTAISAPTVALNLGNDFAGATGGILADNLIVSSGGNFSGQGSTFTPATTQTVTLSAFGNLTYSSPASLTVVSADSLAGNVSLDVNGDLNVLNPITSPDLVSVSVTGSPTASGLFASSARFALQAGDVSSQLNLNVGTLAASSNNNLNLFQANGLTVGTIGSLVGASAQNTLTLTTGSDLRLDSPLTAQSVLLTVGGQLNNTQLSPAVVSNTLALNVASQNANPLTVNTRSVSGQAAGNLSLAASGTLDVQGLNVANNLSVTGDSNTQLSGPVQAGNVSVALSNGDLTVQGTAQPTVVAVDTVNFQVTKGGLNLAGQALQAPQVLLNVSGNVQGSGSTPNIQTDQLTYTSVTGNFNAALDHLNQQATNVVANTGGNISLSSPHDLTVAASANNLSLTTPGNLTATDTLRGTQSVSLQVGNTLSATFPGVVVSSPLLNLQAGNTGRLNLDVDALSAVGTTLSFVFDRPNFELQSIQGTDVTVSVTGALLVSGPISATNLSLSSLGDMTLGANSVTATTAVLTVGGNLNPSGQTDLNVQNLRLNVDGSVGSASQSLLLGGSTTIAGHVGGNAYLQGETGLTVGSVAGATGFSAGTLPGGGPKGIPFGQTLQLAVNQGDLNLDQNVTAANGTVFLLAPNGRILGNGIVLTQDLGFFAGQSVNILTDVNAIAGVGSTVTITEVDQFTLDGLTMAQVGAFTGITGGVVSITAQNGNINLFDPSLLGQPGVNATISASFLASNGSILGGPGGVNVQSPVSNFQASGSVGSAAQPVLIPRDSDFNSSNPFFVQVYPPLPPSPVLEVIIPGGDISEALAAAGNVTLVDATSLGVTVGTLPTITLRALGARNDPAALVQISWNIPGEDGSGGTQTFRRPYLLDFSLEQLLSQPVNSRFLSLTLEELLNQPVISPMLEKTLEELLQEDLSGD